MSSWYQRTPKYLITGSGDKIDTFWKLDLLTLLNLVNYHYQNWVFDTSNPQICTFRPKALSLNVWQNRPVDPQWSVLINFHAQKWDPRTYFFHIRHLKTKQQCRKFWKKWTCRHTIVHRRDLSFPDSCLGGSETPSGEFDTLQPSWSTVAILNLKNQISVY